MAQELFDRAANCLNEQLPFVLYRKPDENELVGVFQDTDEVFRVKDFTESGFVFAPFDLTSDAILMKMDTVLRGSYNANYNDLAFDLSRNLILNSTIEKHRYLELISNAISKINLGYFDKVVVSRKIDVECKQDHLKIYTRLLKLYEKAFCYFWYHPKIGAWMGATPEILVKSNGTRFNTMSLAGTQNSNDLDAPQWSEKELHEQQLVTDYIFETLKDKVVSLSSSKRESVKAGQLWHLRTEINGSFTPNKFGDVLKSLHPTPAVCGSPFLEAKKFILDNENYNRSFYTGFIGELNIKLEQSRNKNRRNQENSAYKSIVKTSELFVNLRCMQVLKNTATIYVGGGITRDSIPESEWEETVLKSNTMFRVLNHKLQ